MKETEVSRLITAAIHYETIDSDKNDPSDLANLMIFMRYSPKKRLLWMSLPY